MANPSEKRFPEIQAPGSSKWKAMKVSQKDFENGSYKEHFGGGAKQWELRGAFQLFFLKNRGLVPSSRLLDVGCGPIRSGVHFIRYLDKGNYFGFDYNDDLIGIARRVCVEQGLVEKNPGFAVVKDFTISDATAAFDYAIAFSVLNHCDQDQRRQFFSMIGKTLRLGGKAYISHARWLSEAFLAGTAMKLTSHFGAGDLDLTAWDWPDPKRQGVLPIVELTRC